MSGEIKRLYRSRTEMQLAGICGGLGLFFRIDPVVIRLLWVGVTCLTGFLPGIVAYVVAWLIVPLEPVPPTPATQTDRREPHQEHA